MWLVSLVIRGCQIFGGGNCFSLSGLRFRHVDSLVGEDLVRGRDLWVEPRILATIRHLNAVHLVKRRSCRDIVSIYA